MQPTHLHVRDGLRCNALRLVSRLRRRRLDDVANLTLSGFRREGVSDTHNLIKDGFSCQKKKNGSRTRLPAMTRDAIELLSF